MYLIDFIYNGIQLSDKGCMVGYITTSNESNVSLGSDVTFNTIKNNSSNKFGVVFTTYDTPISTSFDIFKNTCSDNETAYFTIAEVQEMMKWLNSKTDKLFIPVMDDAGVSNIAYYGSFRTVTAIHMNGGIVGFSLTFTSNSPFGYKYPATTVNKTIANVNTDKITIKADSDEIGYLYPSKFVVTTTSAGKLTISNTAENNRCVIDNCVASEIITIDCENKIITSSKTHEKLYNDFNYNYPRLVVSETSDENVFSFSIPCTVSIEYAPIRKVGILA